MGEPVSNKNGSPSTEISSRAPILTMNSSRSERAGERASFARGMPAGSGMGQGLRGPLVMDGRHGAKLGRLLLGRRVAEKAPTAYLGTGKVLQEVGLAQRRVKFDMKMKAVVQSSIGRGLV